MIKSVSTKDGGVIIEASLVRPPAIYLDQDSLHDLAEPKSRRDRFLDIFKHKGELLFSWTNAIDIAGPQGGTKREIREFLDALGPFWVPLELSPYKVVDKERGSRPKSGTACVSESFLDGYFREPQRPTLTLAHVVDFIHKRRDHVLSQTENVKNAAWQMVAAWRSEYIKDPSFLDRTRPPEALDSSRPATFLLRELERTIVQEAKSYKWMPNDAIDFLHATVAGAYADLLLLDKQWKRRVQDAAPKRPHHWVFYRNELDEFLDVFEQSVIVPDPQDSAVPKA